jgi:pimeloyl-ACP methyl ester carboxylesterase
MIAPLAKLIDWSVIQLCTMRMPPANGRNPRLEEALQFLNGPDFIPAQSQPARVEFHPGQSGHFRFPTSRPCNLAENNVVYGRVYRCAERWQERPAIVLLHGGGNSFISHRFLFPLIARQCNRAGFNAATLEAPYHYQRRPRQPGALSGPDYLREAEATAQAIAEIRALTGWLMEEGCPAVALWGSSFCGWLAGLTACREARLAAVVLNTPGVRKNLSFAERVFRPGIREALRGQRAALETLNLTSLNLTTAQPAILSENILLIEAIHDLFVPKEHIEELWQAWGRPDIWRLPHGHISISLKGAPGFTGRVLRWLTPRLDAPAVRMSQTIVLPH